MKRVLFLATAMLISVASFARKKGDMRLRHLAVTARGAIEGAWALYRALVRPEVITPL